MASKSYSGQSRTTIWRKRRIMEAEETIGDPLEETYQDEERNELRSQFMLSESLENDYFGLSSDKDDAEFEDDHNQLADQRETESDDAMSCDEGNVEDDSSDYWYSSDDLGDSEPEDEFSGNGIYDEKIYDGANLTVKESAIMLFSFFLHFKLSYSCMASLLKLIDDHLPSGNKMVKSVYVIRKIFSSPESRFKKMQCCNGCGSVLEGINHCTHCTGKGISSFLIIPLEPQIKKMFSQPDFCYAMTEKYHKEKSREDCMENVMDGLLYQKFKLHLKGVYDITLMLYTDGMQVFNSSKMSVWPILFVINELPYAKRYLPQNVIFGGLWYGTTKPNFNAFLLPMFKPLQSLKNGIFVELASGERIKVIAILLSAVADLPAKALLLNMKNFNGYYGCAKCLHKGLSVSLGGRRRVFCYPSSENVELRTHEKSLEHCSSALLNAKATVFGFKGENMFSKLVPDFINGCGIDTMHSVFAGIGGKRLLELWFKSAFRSHEFSLVDKLSLVEERLKKIKPPHFISRRPRSIVNCSAFFKTSEFKNWFYYYSIPVLMVDVMERTYFCHYFLLVHAMYILNQDSISSSDIDKASELLVRFVYDFELLYGKRFMSANVHSLLHLAENVRWLVPAYETSCFPLEALLGKMKKMVSGTRYVEQKIAESFEALQSLPVISSSLAPNSLALKFVESLSTVSNKVEEIDGTTFVIGKLRPVKEISQYLLKAIESLLTVICSEVPKVWIFDRLLKDNFVVQCHSGISHRNCDSSFIICNDSSKFVVEAMVKYKLCDCTCMCVCESNFCAVGKKCIVVNNGMIPANPFINEVRISHEVTCINISEISDVCAHVNIEGRSFLTKRVNKTEME